MQRARQVTFDPSSDLSLAWALTQLDACTARHKRCGQGVSPVLPTRVLKITREGDRYTTRLIQLDNGYAVQGQFACLSHCWGDAPTIRTMSSNIDEWKRDIPWGFLPRTFQDTIRLVSLLEIEYLWIDSLCIVQDDPRTGLVNPQIWQRFTKSPTSQLQRPLQQATKTAFSRRPQVSRAIMKCRSEPHREYTNYEYAIASGIGQHVDQLVFSKNFRF